MSRALKGLASFCVRWRWFVVGFWGLLLVAHFALTSITGGPDTNNDLSLPGTDSQAATDLLAKSFPPQQNGSSPIVFYISDGRLDEGANKAAIKAGRKAVLDLPAVYSAPNPFKNEKQAGFVSDDGHYVFVPVLLNVGSGSLTEEQAGRVFDAATQPAVDLGIEAAVGGPVGSALSAPSTEASEVLGLLAAMFIMALTFGGLVAMGMPVVSAVCGLLVGLGLIGVLSQITSVPSIGPTIATMIGLGVGIDYALFLVTKHQQLMRSGLGLQDSIVRTLATSGGAVVFAGGTVVIALTALMVAGIPFVSALGWSAALAVVTAVLAALTLLPSVLALVGNGINRLRLPWSRRPTATDEESNAWSRWARLVTDHPLVSVLVAVGVLVPLMLPVFSLRLGQEDVGVTALNTTERQAFDLLSAGFGPGYNGPLLVAVELRPAASPSTEYTKDYNKAIRLKKKLKAEQKSLTAQSQELQRQQQQLIDEQAELQRQQQQLLAEESQLNAQKAELEQEQAQLVREASRLRAQAERLRARARVLVVEIRSLNSQLRRLDARAAALSRAIDRASNPIVEERLELRLEQVQAAQQQDRMQRQKLVDRLRVLAGRARELVSEARTLLVEAADLEQQANALQEQADALQQQANALQEQADALQQQANALQRQADALQQQQKQAKRQQKEAEQLQASLTRMLTRAGGDPRGTDRRIVALQDALTPLSEVQRVAPPQLNDAGDAVILSVIATTRPADPATAALVATLRDSTLPPVAEPGMQIHVGGSTAANVDLAALITNKLPLVIGTVILLSFLLLMVVFRSLVIPAQAALANLLSAAAAFGVLTLIFQWGVGLSLVGLDSPYGSVPITSYVPLLMFAALFGLSMDYEVFLVSQIQDHRLGGQSSRLAVRSGLVSAGKVVLAAALIMMAVFGSFIFNADPVIKQFGVGLTVAVGLAAFLVLLLAPAVLSWFGEATWYLPRWLDRLLPHVDLEGHDLVRDETELEARTSTPR